MLIPWKDAYRTGIDEVDFEHRELIDLINRTYDEIAANGEMAAVARFFGDINKAIASHFALEERLMREKKYDEFADHKAEHEALLETMRGIMEEWEAQAGPRDARALGEKLDAWFSVHFRTRDARLHRMLGAH